MRGSSMVERSRTASQASFLLLAISFAFLFVSSQTQICPSGGIEAGIEPLDRSSNATANKHYLLTGKGTINCNGLIREWVLHSHSDCNSSGSATIVFQVWKPTAPLTFDLIGANSFSSADCISPTANFVKFGVASIDQIPVEPGYVIGWYQSANTLQISYDVVNDSNSVYLFYNSGPVSIGSSEGFSNGTDERDFSLKVTVIQGDYPTLDNLPSSVNVKENVPLNTLIFTVLASHIRNFLNANAVALSFSLSPNLGTFNLTNIKNENATLETTKALDYEAQNIYQLSITVTGLGLSTTKVLTVNVVDVNEPFNMTYLPTIITVPAASISAGDQMFSVIIFDPDVNPVFPVKFFLQNWTSPNTIQDIPPISVNPDTGFITASVSLDTWYLQHPLNVPPYPVSITYTIEVLATDGIFNASEYLTINITNVRQPPVFLNLPATIQVDDNVPGNTIIYQVLVAVTTDPILLYRLQTIAPTPFCIDEFSGIMSLCSYAKLDYCNTTQYNVTVTATNSVMSNTSSLTVDLRRIDVAPKFTQAVYSGSVKEKCLPTGSCLPPVPVTSVNITDPDLTCPFSPVSLTCSVISGPGSQFFDVFNCATVQNILPIDVDSDPSLENIHLLVEAQDSNNLTTYATIHVTVINVNDHSPNFTQPDYYGSVPENANGGTSVLIVTATDGDHGINGQLLLYSVSTSDPSFLYLQVDPQSGLVSTKQPLDYETILSPLVLTVWATDKGFPPRNESAVVTVNVTDVNDVRPEIVCSNRPPDEPYLPLPCFYNLDLKYDALIGQNVSDLLLSAYDVDPQPNVIKFVQLVTEDHFSLDPTSGLVRVAKTLDAYTKYVLYVYAKDNGSPILKSRVMYIRIDTYRPDRHWIDITVRPLTLPFDKSAFLNALRNVTYPWFMKTVAITNYDPNVQKDIVLTVYALADDSTYSPENIANQKVFVSRDELLKKLSQNIYGHPADILRDPPFEDNWTVVKVVPSYVNWWKDTVEGIATTVCLSAIAALLVTGAAVAFCKGKQKLCFKPTQSKPPATGQGPAPSKPAPFNSSNQDNVRYRSAHGRRDSVLTVHSAIVEERS